MWNPLTALRRRRRPTSDFADEVETHIALEAERLVADGWAPASAADEAHRRFGNVGAARERFHDARGLAFVEGVAQDIRFGIRVLLRAPVVTAVAVLSLALGIGANTAVFTFVNAVLFKPLPVLDPERLVAVHGNPPFETMSYPEVVGFRARPGPFAGFAAVASLDRSNIAVDHEASDQRTVRVHLVTGDYFALFGVRPQLGRVLTMDDERTPDAHPVVVISDAWWRSRFAHVSDVLGHTIKLNETIYTVVGVAPASFTGDELGQPADLWIPIMMQSEVMTERPNVLLTERSWVRMLARLKPGMTSDRAAVLATETLRRMLVERTDPLTPAEAASAAVHLTSEARGFAPTREDAGEPMVVVWVIVILVLAIACVNVAALLLVRAAAREREITTRLALGATGSRIARLLFIEGALIGGAASIVGVAVAFAGVRWLDGIAGSGMTVLKLDVVPDARVLALTLGASLLAMFAVGFVPARRAASLSAANGLKASAASGGRGVTSRASLGRILVVAQVALALVLVVAAGLFGRTLAELQRQDLGFDRDNVLEAFTAPDQANIAGDRLANLFDATAERVSALPNVREVVVSTRGLLSQFAGMVRTTVPGYTRRPDEMEFVAYNITTPGFFHAAGVRLLLGRDLRADDDGGHPRVAVISESMARHYFKTTNAIGKRYGIARDEGAPIEVVGIVRDAKDASLRDANIDMMYLPYRQNLHSLTQMRVIVRTRGNPAAVAAGVRRVLHDLEPTLPVTAVEPIVVQMGRSIAMERFTALASGLFGAVALLLAAIGMFAMVSHAVVRRTSEIGIRMALGGTRAGVLRMILSENLLLVGIGLAVGVGLAIVASRAIEARLFGVSPTDGVTFVAGVGVMIGVALAAIIVPATRATRVDPAVTLRHE